MTIIPIVRYFDQVTEQFKRVGVYLSDNPLEVLLEVAVIWVVVLMVLRFLRGTRGARVIKGVILLLIVMMLTINLVSAFDRIQYLYRNFLNVIALALVIVFQPEIRRALVRLGETRLFRGSGLRRARVIEEVLGAMAYLSKNKIGGLIAIERQVGLRGIVEAGTRLDAAVSRSLLNTLFWPGSALHDMGVVIRGDRVVAAGVQFPLAEGEYVSQELGSRHRAAMGLAQESDALVLVVSEETGTISIAERDNLTRDLTIDAVRRALIEGLNQTQMPPEPATDATQAA